jgi:hypothetical protein
MTTTDLKGASSHQCWFRLKAVAQQADAVAKQCLKTKGRLYGTPSSEATPLAE